MLIGRTSVGSTAFSRKLEDEKVSIITWEISKFVHFETSCIVRCICVYVERKICVWCRL